MFPEIVDFPQTVNIEGKQVRQLREGDKQTYKVTVPKYGNKDGWIYTWKMDGAELPIDSTVSYTPYFSLEEGEQKHYIDANLTLTCENLSPEAELWESRTITFPQTRIYRVPQKPDLKKKGNGQSNIYIACGMTTEQATKLDYWFIFGDGEDGEGYEPTRDRAYYYKSPVSDPWVKALWKYDDGFWCKSNTVWLRKDIAPSTRAEGILEFDGSHFSVTLDEPCPGQVLVSSTNGQLVKAFHYDARDVYDEDLDFSDLTRGIYVIKFQIGDNLLKGGKLVIK